MMPITLKEAISEELKDKEFVILYERERIINSIVCTVVDLRQRQGLTQSELAHKARQRNQSLPDSKEVLIPETLLLNFSGALLMLLVRKSSLILKQGINIKQMSLL